MAPAFAPARLGRALATVAPYLLGAIGLMVLLVAARNFIGSTGFAYDFRAYDLAARRIMAGEPLYPPGVAEAYNSGALADLYLYAPPLAVFLAPITAIPADVLAVAWLWLRLALLIAACAILPVPRAAKLATLGVAGLSFPVLYDLNLGNLSIVLFVLSALIWRYRDRPIASVVLAAVLTVRYSFALVLVGWLVRRAWRPIGWTIVAGLGIGLATLPIVGIDGWRDYLTILTALSDISTGPQNFNLGTTAVALGLPLELKPLVQVLQLAFAIGAAAWAARRRDPELAMVVALTGTILFLPFLHPHYLVQLLVPAAFLAGRGQWWGLGLPFLAWLPGESMSISAVLAIVSVFAAPSTPAPVSPSAEATR